MNQRLNPSRTGRRRALHTLAAAAIAMLAAAGGPAQAAWPERPIRVIVPYAAGQGADVLMRVVAQELSKNMGQSFIIDNKAGAGGNIGTAAAAKALPDGYTFTLGTNATHAANEFLYTDLGFAPADFVSVAMIGLLPMVISTSSANLPVNGIAELIEQARAKPDSFNIALPSTTAAVVHAQFLKAASVTLMGVKYKASGQAVTDVLGGQVPLLIDTVTATRPQLASGRLKALGITSLKASELLPGIKPVSEQGVAGFDVVAWDALFAPKGTPPDIVARLGAEIQRVLEQPDTRRKLLEIGVEPLSMGPAQLDRFVKDERPKWGRIIKTGNINVD